MVSLSNSASQPRGLYGFSEDRVAINTAEPDDDLIVDHIDLVSGPEVFHRPMKTVWAIVLAKIIYIALGVSAYIIPLKYCTHCTHDQCRDKSLSLLMYIHGGIWFTLFGLDRYFHLKHEESRLYGYLEFYRKTRNIQRIPVLINSCANAVMVIVVKLLDDYCGCDSCYSLSKITYIQIVIGIECVLAVVVLVVYLVHTVRFNSRKTLPDVSQEDLSPGFGAANGDLGFRNENYDDQVLEKQADMIRYLKQHTEALAKRNLTLTEEISRLKTSRQTH